MRDLTPQEKESVRRFIDETDWDAFWQKRVEASNESVDAYREAEARSRGIIHVLLAA